MPPFLGELRGLVDARRRGAPKVQEDRPFSPEAKKGMGLLALAAVACLLGIYLIFAWQGAAAERLRQAEAEHELVAARAAKARSDGATRLTAADNVAPMFLDGSTPGLSAATFQGLAGDAASRAGLAIKRMQLMETGDEQAGTPYRISVDAQGSIEQLRTFLADVEQALPVMFVTGLELQPEAAEGQGDGYPSEDLRMSFRIDAYGWRPAP